MMPLTPLALGKPLNLMKPSLLAKINPKTGEYKQEQNMTPRKKGQERKKRKNKEEGVEGGRERKLCINENQ